MQVAIKPKLPSKLIVSAVIILAGVGLTAYLAVQKGKEYAARKEYDKSMAIMAEQNNQNAIKQAQNELNETKKLNSALLIQCQIGQNAWTQSPLATRRKNPEPVCGTAAL